MKPSSRWWTLLKQSVTSWKDDYAPSMGAALSYYTVFSLAPILLIVIAVAGLVFGQDAARGALFEQIAGLMGADAARAIEEMLNGVTGESLLPAQRLSKRIVRNCRTRNGRSSPHIAREKLRPIIMSSGSPEPSSSQ